MRRVHLHVHVHESFLSPLSIQSEIRNPKFPDPHPIAISLPISYLLTPNSYLLNSPHPPTPTQKLNLLGLRLEFYTLICWNKRSSAEHTGTEE